MKLLVAIILLSIGAIGIGSLGSGDYRMPFVGLVGWLSLFLATVLAGLIQLSRARRRRN